MIWFFVIVAALIVGGWLALQSAIARNGPAVLDTVDRITGGERETALLYQTNLGGDPATSIRVFGPQTASTAPRPVILFIHGGSWASGDPADYGFVARGLVPEGATVVLAGYHLYPNAVFPQMLIDTAQAIAWTRANIAQHGGDPAQLYLMGHSAGGYNAVMSVLDPQWLAREGLDDGAIAGVIGLASPHDFYPFDSPSTINSFGGASNPETTQPINFARGDAPPMLFLHGEQDTTVYPRNSAVLAKAITQKGGKAEAVFYPAMDHTAILTALASPWRRDPAVIDAITAFVVDTKASVPVQDETG